MRYLGFIKRVVPFVMTLALGLFVASFFMVLSAPNIDVNLNRSWSSNHSHDSDYRQRRRIRRAEMRMERAQRRIERARRRLERMKVRIRRIEIKKSDHEVKRLVEIMEIPAPMAPPVAQKKK